MLKKLTTGIIGATLVIGLTGCQSELENEDLKGLKSCFTKPSGVVLWSNDILTVTNRLRNTGTKITVLKNGSELILDMGNEETIVLEEIDYNDSSCYEVQKITGDKGELVKDSGDNFLLVTAQFFGRLGLTKKEKQERENRIALEKQKKQDEQNKKKKAIQEKVVKAEKIYNLIEKESQKLNNFIVLKKKFDNKYKLRDMDDAKKLIITDSVLNELLNIIEKYKIVNTNIDLPRNSSLDNMIIAVKKDINNFNPNNNKIATNLIFDINKELKKDLKTRELYQQYFYSTSYNDFNQELRGNDFGYLLKRAKREIDDAKRGY